ncbi:MAG: hypothetical protein JNK79_06950 [Chitinophagaceae bacterium]|nr:hypothetical protein [Chitinophagaceae bacterium]
MKVVVLGASGQIGSVIYNCLTARYDLIGTSRQNSGRYLKFDPFRDDWSLLGNVNVLINCVGQIEATGSFSFTKIHEGLTRLIIENRSLIGNPRIIQVSALGASPQHRVEFLRTKGIADELLMQQPDTFILRPSIVCTHNTMLVRKMLMMRRISQYIFGIIPVPQGFLKTRIQPLMPNDLANVVEFYCRYAGPQVMNIAGSEVLSFGEILTMMGRKSNRKIKPVNISGFFIGIIVKAGLLKVINQQQYQLLFEDNTADITPVKAILKKEPVSGRDFFINEFSHAQY